MAALKDEDLSNPISIRRTTSSVMAVKPTSMSKQASALEKSRLDFRLNRLLLDDSDERCRSIVLYGRPTHPSARLTMLSARTRRSVRCVHHIHTQ
jgi:hypothetical protein